MCPPFRYLYRILKFILCLFGFIFLRGQSGEISIPIGALSISLPAGSPDSPSYKIVSPGIKGNVVFRGQVKQVNGDNVVFHRVPELLDPSILAWPFKAGILASKKARAQVFLDLNQSIDRIELIDGGEGYSVAPKVSISLPSDGNQSWVNYEPAFAYSSINSGSVIAISIDSNYSGKGYTAPPQVEIEGGIHFLRSIETDSIQQGKFFRILSNTGDTLSLDNSVGSQLSTDFPIGSMVEVIESWTLGSLFGYNNTSFNEGNSTVADYIYLIKPPGEQNGTIYDYHAYYHDGNMWRDTNGSPADASQTLIYPDESFIVACRSPNPIEIPLNGLVITRDSFMQIPASGSRSLINNPFGVDVMLSDLIPSVNLTNDTNDSAKWLVSADQEVADNVGVLIDGVWTTYWHDGTNMGITEQATLTARMGTGVAGSITPQDLSMSSGQITAMTNPDSGNIVVSSPNHSLRRGFVVHISGAYGRKTNNENPKQQVDEDGTIVPPGQGLLISSAANGFFEVANVTSNTFELLNKTGNCDFTGLATWKTGSSGAGYTSPAYVVFLGGGGQGAAGIAYMSGGSVQSITITSPGYGYRSAPKAFINSGGWRRIGSGNSPFNNALVPAGSGLLLKRNHPTGSVALLGISNPSKQ
jgi:hypothetical protein